jgi:hypothetical protein
MTDYENDKSMLVNNLYTSIHVQHEWWVLDSIQSARISRGVMRYRRGADRPKPVEFPSSQLLRFPQDKSLGSCRLNSSSIQLRQ